MSASSQRGGVAGGW